MSVPSGTNSLSALSSSLVSELFSGVRSTGSITGDESSGSTSGESSGNEDCSSGGVICGWTTSEVPGSLLSLLG